MGTKAKQVTYHTDCINSCMWKCLHNSKQALRMCRYLADNIPEGCSTAWTTLIPWRRGCLILIFLITSPVNRLLKKIWRLSLSLHIIISSNTSIDHGCAFSGSCLTTVRPVPSSLIVSTVLFIASTQYSRLPGKSIARPFGQDMEVLTSEVKSEPSVFKLNIPGLLPQSQM